MSYGRFQETGSELISVTIMRISRKFEPHSNGNLECR